ncbi:hypothetical protein NXT3_PC00403 (plasmid) [Sinorhizobium fredii]|uniref:Uncharacterized protein n=1 Tax=Rhizobium fredii TaxID=380 RepID=A0A2L0HDJ4_RHIFR|nr:hypothetical protein NXT3_PC00403 [Sinorhizobium fredii]
MATGKIDPLRIWGHGSQQPTQYKPDRWIGKVRLVTQSGMSTSGYRKGRAAV